jgi:hypothetical protein
MFYSIVIWQLPQDLAVKWRIILEEIGKTSLKRLKNAQFTDDSGTRYRIENYSRYLMKTT